MNMPDTLDELLGQWQQEADRRRVLSRLDALYRSRKEALVVSRDPKPPGTQGLEEAGSPAVSESLRDALRESLADLLAWYWKTIRSIIEFYEKRGQ